MQDADVETTLPDLGFYSFIQETDQFTQLLCQAKDTEYPFFPTPMLLDEK